MRMAEKPMARPTLRPGRFAMMHANTLNNEIIANTLNNIDQNSNDFKEANTLNNIYQNYNNF